MARDTFSSPAELSPPSAGSRGCLTGRHPRSARPQGQHDQAGSVHQRRSRHHEPVPARRGVRHRRRRARPTSTSATTSASCARTTSRNSNFTTGRIYERVIAQGAPRRLPRRDGAGDPAHHRRDQALRSAWARATRTSCIVEIGGTVGDIESLPFLEAIRQFGVESGRNNVAVHAPDAGPVHRELRRDQDQADAALGQGAALDRHSARRPAVPRAEQDAARAAPQDRAVHERRGARRHLGASTPTTSTRFRMLLHEQGLDDIVVDKLRTRRAAPPTCREWRRCVAAQEQPETDGRRSRWSASTSTSATPT